MKVVERWRCSVFPSYSTCATEGTSYCGGNLMLISYARQLFPLKRIPALIVSTERQEKHLLQPLYPINY